ncbi:MAG: sigma-54-dependent Fis family transcriptional regulator [Gemmatimonadetes bacterium]|nr:sigma-54-dependent Fis family transcriptional regulator [Gemmatimonadota bacterium]
MPTILLIDDEPNIRRMLGALLRAEGFDVVEAANGNAALIELEQLDPDAAFCDLMMPPGPDGLATLEAMRARGLEAPVIMMSGKAQLSDAVRATQLGAFQFLEKPLSPEAVLVTLRSALELRRTQQENRVLRTQVAVPGELIGTGRGMTRVWEQIAQVAPTDTRVLITGESGTGKELVAAAIHRGSRRAKRAFIPVNCAAIPRELVESELFGHERGAFTGATERRLGRFALADGGTILLDEIGDLSLEAQAKLLRVLETGELQRVGAERAERVDVRVLAATNRQLEQAVAAGTFREDLYFRLNVFPILLPPLRDRAEDITSLVGHLARRVRPVGTPTFTPAALESLRRYPWPGNVRELANIVERLIIVGGGKREIDVDAVVEVLPQASGVRPQASGAEAPGPELPLSEALDAHERRLIRDALARSNGNVAEAARSLRTDRANLYRRMRRLGL